MMYSGTKITQIKISDRADRIAVPYSAQDILGKTEVNIAVT